MQQTDTPAGLGSLEPPFLHRAADKTQPPLLQQCLPVASFRELTFSLSHWSLPCQVYWWQRGEWFYNSWQTLGTSPTPSKPQEHLCSCWLHSPNNCQEEQLASVSGCSLIFNFYMIYIIVPWGHKESDTTEQLLLLLSHFSRVRLCATPTEQYIIAINCGFKRAFAGALEDQ